MKALILAAGRGRRMGQLTSDAPKALLKVGHIPLLRHALNALSAAGIKEVGIVTGYQAELLAWPEFSRRFHNGDWETTNMVYSLNCAREWLASGETLVCYSDILFQPATILRLMQTPGDLAIANNLNWREVWSKRFQDPLSDAETFKKNSEGKLVEIGMKPKTMDDIQGQYMGLLKFTAQGWERVARFLDSLPKERFAKIDMTSTLNELLNLGLPIASADISEPWFEFDSEEDLRVYV
jgi:choline kinase